MTTRPSLRRTSRPRDALLVLSGAFALSAERPHVIPGRIVISEGREPVHRRHRSRHRHPQARSWTWPKRYSSAPSNAPIATSSEGWRYHPTRSRSGTDNCRIPNDRSRRFDSRRIAFRRTAGRRNPRQQPQTVSRLIPMAMPTHLTRAGRTQSTSASSHNEHPSFFFQGLAGGLPCHYARIRRQRTPDLGHGIRLALSGEHGTDGYHRLGLCARGQRGAASGLSSGLSTWVTSGNGSGRCSCGNFNLATIWGPGNPGLGLQFCGRMVRPGRPTLRYA